jgi:hypothetical protein
MAFFILKNCMATQKVVYLLRTATTFMHLDNLTKYDRILQEAVEHIANISCNESKWKLATLPIDRGGIGMRSAGDLAIPAFLSSSFATENIVIQLLPNFTVEPPDRLRALDIWHQTLPNRPEADQQHKQAAWDKINTDKSRSEYQAQLQSDEDEIHLSHNSTSESGNWLQAFPSPLIGTLLDDKAFQIALAFRTGTDICNEHTCLCGAKIDTKGRHVLGCKKCTKGRLGRHSAINDILGRAIRQAGFAAILEPAHLNRTDGKRPDGVTLTPWFRGAHLVWDVTVIDSYAASYRDKAMSGPGMVAEVAEKRKIEKYINFNESFTFLPFALETTGVWGKQALKLIKRLGTLIRLSTGETRATSFIKQRISIEIMRGNALALLETTRTGDQLHELFNM